MLVPDILRGQAQQAPSRIAVQLDGAGQITFAEWEARSNRLARALVNRGLQADERVLLLVTNADAIEFAVAYLAIHKAGGVAVPLNPRLTQREQGSIAAHCLPSAIVYGRKLEEAARALEPNLKGAAISLDWQQVMALGEQGDDSRFQVSRNDEDLADILYTSGTTGSPKGVACTHGNVSYKGGSGMEAAFAGATYLHAISLCTFAGTHAMTLIPLRAGMTNLVMPRFDPKRFLELISEKGVNIAYAVPSMVLLMLEQARIQEGGFDSLRLLMYGTAPMPPAAIRRLAEVFPSTMLLNLYGLTEGGAAVCLLPPHEAQKRPDSLGRPLPPTEVRIVADDGSVVEAGETGEIWLRAPVRPRSYFRDEASSAETWTSDGWVKTGDIGRFDTEGYLYLVDRKKDLIIRGGFNISAPEVEAALVEHPGVRDAAVVGIPHEVLGEDTRAVVVTAEGQSLDATELEAFLRERLADFKVPRRYDFVPELPRNALGKVLKRVLRDEARP